jgi:hypothetical protein
MNLENLATGLGIGGFVALLLYRLGIALINKWATASGEQTAVLADGFKTIGQKIDDHARADAASHKEMASEISEFRGQIAGVLEVGGRLTPVHGTPVQRRDPPTEYSHHRPKTSGG